MCMNRSRLNIYTTTLTVQSVSDEVCELMREYSVMRERARRGKARQAPTANLEGDDYVMLQECFELKLCCKARSRVRA